MNSHPDLPADAWLDLFLQSWLARHPVDATFVGVPDHDRRLPDLSPEGVAETVSALRDLLDESAPVSGENPPSDGVPDSRAPGDHSLTGLDRRLARGALKIRLWEYESRCMLANPSVHSGDAVFGMMSLLLVDLAPDPRRMEALAARMRALPRFISEAREHLDRAPIAWTQRAIRECRGGLAFLAQGLEHVDHDFGDAPAVAADALREYSDFLEGELLQRPREVTGCGAEAFALLLREGHGLTQSADEIVAYARDELVRTRAWLEEMAADHDATDPEEVTGRLADHHPTAADYYAKYETTWSEMRLLALERALVTWPDVPIRYVPRPAWSRAAAPDLYFLFYRSPAAFDPPDVHDYMVAPLPDDADAATTEAFLRANNDSVIKLNHVVHHGGIGHHVQNWHARRSPLRVGRVAAVDCASRIAMFCGGTMAEGWACYATDLMAEAGALTPLEQYAEHAGRVRMCARAIVDVELHHGRMTLDEAAEFYVETAGMSLAAGEAEAVKNSMFPGAALMYLIGTDTIHDLRRDVMQAQGDRFQLAAFHDAFLSYGSIPARVVADEMRRRLAVGAPLGAHDEVPA